MAGNRLANLRSGVSGCVVMRKCCLFVVLGALGLLNGVSLADSSPPGDVFTDLSDPAFAVAAVQTRVKAETGKKVRIAIYDGEASFLKEALDKRQGVIGENGIAVLSLNGLAPGEYSIAAYLDENDDGELNRGSVFGFPKEPVAFSNGVKPALRKPRFDETKVVVAPGRVIVITLDD